MLIYPMFAMVMLTTVVGICALITRVRSVRSGTVKARSYKLMNAADYPDSVLQTTRNFNNQFEVPVLFYVACVAYMAMGVDSLFALVSAWAFVVFRVVHAYIHITYNHLLHRMTVFWLAIFAVLALWINLVLLTALS